MASIRRTALAFSLAVTAGLVSGAALADGVSDNVVKIGVLTDMSGQFSHESGEGLTMTKTLCGGASRDPAIRTEA